MSITTEEAKKILLLHAFDGDLNDPERNSTFLKSLRPYKGLLEENFHEIMNALRIYAPELQNPLIDKQVISALWSIYYLGRNWAIEPDGMLQRHNLMTTEDTQKIAEWLNIIGWAVYALLNGRGIKYAFVPYDNKYGNR